MVDGRDGNAQFVLRLRSILSTTSSFLLYLSLPSLNLRIDSYSESGYCHRQTAKIPPETARSATFFQVLKAILIESLKRHDFSFW